MALPAETNQRTEEKPKDISERDVALELASRAEALAKELLSLPVEARRLATEAFLAKKWTTDEIRRLVSGISIKSFRKVISWRLR